MMIWVWAAMIGLMNVIFCIANGMIICVWVAAVSLCCPVDWKCFQLVVIAQHGKSPECLILTAVHK